MINEKLAPIVLFVYNRPNHTLKTLTALCANHLASESRLYIYCDAAKENASEETKTRVSEVRSIVHSQSWCGEVHVVEQAQNQGLYRSIRAGVTSIIHQYGRVIVMEDDLVTSPAFLDYMNESLNKYSAYPSVFSIGGYTYPESIMPIPDDYDWDNYVCLRNCSWGWATWKNRWDLVDWDVDVYDYMRTHSACINAFNRMGDDEFPMLEGRMSGKLNIWSIQFTVAHFVHHAVAMCPIKSYVNNVGLDGSGENCGVQTRLYHKSLCSNRKPKLTNIAYEDSRIINAFYNVNCRRKCPLWMRIWNKLVKVTKRYDKILPKGRVYA